MTTSTTSKAKKVQYAYGEFIKVCYFDRFNAVDSWVASSRESLDSKARDMKAQIVWEMKGDLISESAIASELMISKQEVAKLAIRAIALNYGLDGQGTVELVNQAGNGITKVAIESIVKQGLKDKATKAEIAEQLQGLGLATKEAKTREARNAGGTKATNATRTAKALAQLEKIQKDAFAGKLNVTAILDKLQDMEAELSLKA